MIKKSGVAVICTVLFVLLLSGCKMPASKAPSDSTAETKTTPIRIQTDSPANMTQTAFANAAATITEQVVVQPTPTATPEPTEVIPVPTVTRPAQYIVKEGEYPYCLARRFDLNPEDLLSLNQIGDYVSPGTKLEIPQSGAWPGGGRSLIPHPTTYIVAQGDTVYSIACKYGDVTPEAIIAVNKLAEPYTLTPGQTLNIP